MELMTESRQIISNLIKFQKKHESLNKKMVKPRKRYFCEDDVILNSLSNNKLDLEKEKKFEKVEDEES